jgi:flavin-dependent dehydrogenase
MSTEQSWDVVVIGAGVGGMALATQLAQGGYRVVIVERTPPPAFRVGESLDWEAPLFLRRLGLPVEKLVAEGKATWKPGAIATNAQQPGVEVRAGLSPLFRLLMTLVGRGKPTIHANRELLDGDLMDRTRAAGVELVVGRARTVEAASDWVTGVVLADGRVLRGKFYVDATGSAALFRKAFGIGQRTIGPRKVVVRARFAHAYDGMGTRIRTDDTLTEPAWIWDINVSDDITDVGLVVTEGDFVRLRQRIGTLRDVFLHQAGKHEDLRWLPPLVTEGTDFWTCSFQDSIADRSHGPNWIAVGEAAFVVDALLSTGFTTALRTGFFASAIIAGALARRSGILCPTQRRIYHVKTAAQVQTTNRLLDVLWYRGRLRDHYSLALNVLSILAVNFNLNHLHSRWVPRTLFELRLLTGLHKVIDVLVPRYNDILTRRAARRGKVNPHGLGRDPREPGSGVPIFTGTASPRLRSARGAASVTVWTPPAPFGTSCWSAATATSSPTGSTPVPISD